MPFIGPRAGKVVDRLLLTDDEMPGWFRSRSADDDATALGDETTRRCLADAAAANRSSDEEEEVLALNNAAVDIL